MNTLPDVDVLVRVADQALYPAVRRWRPESDRRAAPALRAGRIDVGGEVLFPLPS